MPEFCTIKKSSDCPTKLELIKNDSLRDMQPAANSIPECGSCAEPYGAKSSGNGQ
jgi:hypothetical protein